MATTKLSLAKASATRMQVNFGLSYGNPRHVALIKKIERAMKKSGRSQANLTRLIVEENIDKYLED